MRYRSTLVVPLAVALASTSVSADESDTRRQACFQSPSATCVLALATQLVTGPSGDDQTSMAQNLITGTTLMGDFADATAFTAKIPGTKDRLETLKRLSDHQWDSGDLEGARATQLLAYETATKLQPGVERAQELSSFAGLQADELGDPLLARTTISAALAEINRLEPGPRCCDLALSFLGSAQAEIGDVAAAVATANRITDSGAKSSVLIDVAGAQAAAGALDQAVKTAESISNSIQQGAAFGRIARAQAAAGDLPGMFATLQRTDEQQRAWTLGDVASDRANEKQFSTALQVAHRIDEFWTRNEAIVEIAVQQRLSGDLRGALETAALIELPGSRATVQADIARDQNHAGDNAGARQTIAEARKALYDVKGAEELAAAALSVARAQGEVGDKASAIELLKGSRLGLRDINPGDYDYPERLFLTVAEFAAVQAALGDVEGAKDTATILSAPGSSEMMFMLARIAEGQAEAGDSVGARSTMTGVLDAAWGSAADVRAVGLGVVLGALRKIGWN